jgi:SAM-dependent methyltransferase
MICRICGNAGKHLSWMVREMMYGTGDQFEYFQCAECGCLQLREIPPDISPYYPDDYYSYQHIPKLRDNVLKSALKRLRARLALSPDRSLLPRLFLRLYPPPDYFVWFREAGVGLDDAILDVGCGIGHLLIRLRKDGFRDLTGLDPFLPEAKIYENGVMIYNRSLSDLTGSYDFVMSHHSLEHMPNQLAVMKTVHRLLKHGRFFLVRIPVASGIAWKRYRENWVNLDAPRHFYLHTPASMKILADAAGFELRKITFDSTGFQFWGSEQYQNNIPLRSERSYAENPGLSSFSSSRVKEYERQARELNEKQEGDEACFYLYKP